MNYTYFVSFNYAQLVGVADPTSAIPNDTVFIPKLNARHTGGQVFITRYPCTERKDGKLLKILHHCPQTMTIENWNFLQSIPYGILVFGPSSSPLSLPEQIADGDLDGDLYHVLWDYSLVQKLVEVEDDETGNGTRSDEKIDEEASDESGKHYLVEILDHNKNEIQVRWEKIPSGEIIDNWEPMSNLKNEAPEMLADYARENGLLTLAGWLWAKRYVRNEEMKFIVSHSVDDDDNETMNFNVKYGDGEMKVVTLDDMKNDEPKILYKYAIKHNLLPEWTTKYAAEAQTYWFENAQDYAWSSNSCTIKLT